MAVINNNLFPKTKKNSLGFCLQKSILNNGAEILKRTELNSTIWDNISQGKHYCVVDVVAAQPAKSVGNNIRKHNEYCKRKCTVLYCTVR